MMGGKKEKRTKNLSKFSIEGTYINIAKSVYDKLTFNISLEGENLKTFPLTQEQKSVPTLTTYLLHSVDIPSHCSQT